MTNTPEAFYERANRFKIQGRIQEAVHNYDAALRLRPNFPEALCSSAILLQEGGFCDAALRFYNQALRIKPDFPEALYNRGNVLHCLNRFDNALESYDEAIALKPAQAAFYVNRGASLYELGRIEEAIASYETALRLDNTLRQGALNLGNALMKAGRLDTALAAYEHALTLNPNYSRALCGKGIVLKELGQFDEAMRCFDLALALDPQSNEIMSNKGCLHLLLGDFEQGWKGYEHRWVLGDKSAGQLQFSLPVWNGDMHIGQHILVINDHALGDIIQFSRFLTPILQGGAHVTFLCPQKMHKLIASLHPSLRLISELSDTNQYDCQIMLGSLPHRLKINADTIPAEQVYLQADPALVARWSQKIGQKGFKIGLNWQGNMDIKVDPQRSFRLESCMSLAKIAGVRLISLQKGAGTEQLSPPDPALPIEIFDMFDEGTDAFVDTAAIMCNLDLIITCDTSIAHLAGALGCPVWVALKHVPEWRWQTKRSDSPWYPSMELFRQPARDDWTSVFNMMADRLTKMLHKIRA